MAIRCAHSARPALQPRHLCDQERLQASNYIQLDTYHLLAERVTVCLTAVYARALNPYLTRIKQTCTQAFFTALPLPPHKAYAAAGMAKLRPHRSHVT